MPYLNLDDAQIYYADAGRGAAFIMLHAGIAHSAMWAPQVAYFQEDYRVVVYDQRGFGKTTTTTNTFNWRADLLALMNYLQIERAILMGCSMGGSIAIDFALEHPERVVALILIAAGVSGNESSPELVKQWEEQDAAFAAGDNERGIELELQMWVAGPKRTPAQVNPAVRAKIRAMEAENLKINSDGYKPIQLDPPAISRLGEIHVPTLILVGKGDQPSVVELAPKLAREIPNAQLIEFENVAHVPSMEIPAEVNRVIEEFLTTHSFANS